MSEDWQYVALEEMAAAEPSAISKPYGSAILKSDYRVSGIPVVRGVNLADGIFHDDSFVFIDESVAARMPGAHLKAGDLVVTHRGTVGQVSMIPRSPRFNDYVASTSQVKVRLDESKAVPEFYYYYFSSPQGRQAILENVSTVGVPGLVQPVATVKRLSVPAPPRSLQVAIAEVLGALDDKIAANATTADTALQLALVTFADAVAVNPSSFKALGQVANVVLGGTPDKTNPDYWSHGMLPWLNSGAANRDRIIEPTHLITDEGLAKSAAKLMPVGATVIAITGATLGQIARLEIEASGNQSLVGVYSDDDALNAWLHLGIRHQVSQLLVKATGAAQQHVNRKDVLGLEVPMLSSGLTEEYGTQFLSTLDTAAAFEKESLTLGMIRDTLLPQLMSGKLRVKDAEKVVEGAL